MSNEIPWFVTVNTQTLSDKVSEYVSEMETQRTNDWCHCEWIVHPDDKELDVYNCANCHHPHTLHMSGPDSYCTKEGNFIDVAACDCTQWVDPPKRRMRRGQTHPECPVHTKEGFLVHFFRWAWERGDFDVQ